MRTKAFVVNMKGRAAGFRFTQMKKGDAATRRPSSHPMNLRF
jgi:hypothetical protein